MGLQGGFCLCLWDSMETRARYQKWDWPQRSEGRTNIKWESLVKVLMSPLHVNLGVMKLYVPALNKESAAFRYFQDFFPKLSKAKVNVFVRPQTRSARNSLGSSLGRRKQLCRSGSGFLGNHKAKNYFELVETLVKNNSTRGFRISPKVHVFDAHLEKFKENMGAYLEEQGECFHQEILDSECSNQRQYNENLIGDYI